MFGVVASSGRGLAEDQGLTTKQAIQRARGPKAQRPGRTARIWPLSYGRALRPAVGRLREEIRKESDSLDVSLARYIVRVLDGLGKRGRTEAYGIGCVKGGHDEKEGVR